jgi:uncharacterized tellurite resistance protein B-like protein
MVSQIGNFISRFSAFNGDLECLSCGLVQPSVNQESTMRTYPRNSPRAAGRIVALAMVADGHLSKTEIDTLEQVGAYQQLGLDRETLHEVLQGFCEDLLQAGPSHWADATQIDARTLNQLLAEVDDPALRSVVLRLCIAVIEGDGHIAGGESIVLASAVEQWGLTHWILDLPNQGTPSEYPLR